MKYICAALVCFISAVPHCAAGAALQHNWANTSLDPYRSYCTGEVSGVWCHVTGRWAEWSFGRYQQWKGCASCPVDPPDFGDKVKLASLRAEHAAGRLPLADPIGPPVAMPAGPPQNFGRTDGGEQGYWRNGERVTRDDVLHDIQSRIPDAAHMRRITVIGKETDRKAAVDIIGSPSWAVVRVYDPDDWYVAWQGFVRTGAPTVYIQEPDGTVLHRQDNLDGLKQAVARSSPDYDPAKDPDLRNPHKPANPNRPSNPDQPQPGPGILDELDWRSVGVGAAGSAIAILAWSILRKEKTK